MKTMKNLNILSKGLNVVLGVIYIPLSFFSWLLMMASETTIDITNELYINLLDVFCVIAFAVPFLFLSGVVFSAVLRKKGHSVWSLVVLFLPLIVFILDMCLLMLAENLI